MINEDAFALDVCGRLLWPCHMPHTRDLALQGREAQGARARAKHIWPAIARFVVGWVLGAACELAFGDGVCASRVVIGPCCQRAAQY